MRALLIDNSRTYRQILGELFSEYDIDTDTADSVAGAREKLDDEFIDVLCVSQHLKDGNGQEIIEYAQTHLRNKPSIILLTSDEKTNTDGLAIDRVIQKSALNEVTEQITLFIEKCLDPLVHDGRILLVEDHQSTVKVLSKLLEDNKYRIDTSASGKEAWELFESETTYGSEVDAFDLVITDLTLADNFTGLDLIAKIRELKDARGQVPIMAITATDDENRRMQLFGAGINDYLTKPVLPEAFCLRATNLITQKSLLDRVHDQRRELHRLATTDKLTGCANRHNLTEYAAKFVSQSQRHEYPISLLVIDLDHFKAVNDTHGHHTGDEVLKEVGKLLLRSVREGDMAARFGGEEFVLLLNYCNLENALKTAENLRAKLEKLKPAKLPVTASIGVSTLSQEYADFESLFQAADEGVYAAKEGGRNRVVSLQKTP